MKYKYNPINSIFKEENVTLKVVESKDNGRTCHGCWYNGRSIVNGKEKRNYGASCYLHKHLCTPTLRKDKKQVIFVEVKS